MSRPKSLCAVVLVALLAAACADGTDDRDGLADGSLAEAERICDGYQPPEDPDAELLLFSLTTFEAVDAALQALEHPPVDPNDWSDEEGGVAICSYSSLSPTSAPTTMCRDGTSVSLSEPLQYFVRSDGEAIEYPQTPPDAESVPCPP